MNWITSARYIEAAVQVSSQ